MNDQHRGEIAWEIAITITFDPANDELTLLELRVKIIAEIIKQVGDRGLVAFEKLLEEIG